MRCVGARDVAASGTHLHGRLRDRHDVRLVGEGVDAAKIDRALMYGSFGVWGGEYRSTGVQEYGSTGVQEYRSTGVQEYGRAGGCGYLAEVYAALLVQAERLQPSQRVLHTSLVVACHHQFRLLATGDCVKARVDGAVVTSVGVLQAVVHR